MNIERSMVEKITITGLKNYTPITVVIENGETEEQANIKISCFGETWSHYWGSMGSSIGDFFNRCDNDYLISKLTNIPQKEEDLFLDWKVMRDIVAKARRRREISETDARQAYYYILFYKPDRHEFGNGLPDDLQPIEELREYWYIDWPMRDNPKYNYISGIIDAVRIALNTEKDC